MQIFCVQCNNKKERKLTYGYEIYPHRPDLKDLKFWKCEDCGNFVGCHKGQKNSNPLGIIANKQIKNARQHIHKLMDPWWDGPSGRGRIYKYLSINLGYQYHTANIRSIEEARTVWRLLIEYGTERNLLWKKRK